MADSDPPAEKKATPGLDLVVTEFDRRQADQEHRRSAFDTRAGLMLATGGVVVGLTHPAAGWIEAAGQITATLAAFAAVRALWPALGQGMGVRELRDSYLTQPPEQGRLKLLDTRIELYLSNEMRVQFKARWVRIAILLLAASAVLLVAGSILRPNDTTAPDPGDQQRHEQHQPRVPGRGGSSGALGARTTTAIPTRPHDHHVGDQGRRASTDDAAVTW